MVPVTNMRYATTLPHILHPCLQISLFVKFLVYTQGGIKCGPSSRPDFIKNYFLLTRMLEFFDRRDKHRKSGLEAPLMGGVTF